MEATRSRRLVFIWMLFPVLLFSHPAWGKEAIDILSPKGPHLAGQSIIFHIQAREFTQPVKASLFYRTIGITIYRKVPMKQESPVDFRAFIKGQKAIPPGLEYYFVLKDGKGRVFTFPELDPKKHPYRLKIRLDVEPPRIIETIPPEGAAIEDLRPAIRIAYEDKESQVDTESVRLLLDGRDVTQLSEVDEKGITFTPPMDLSHGKHTVTLAMSDIYGNRIKPQSWTFSVPRSRKWDLERGEARLQWDAEMRHKLVDKETNQQPSWNINSSLTADASAEWRDVKTSFNANLWYVEEQGPAPEGDNFNLNHFLYQLEKGPHQLALGDVTVQGTELVSQAISRRGGSASLDLEGTKAQVFALRSNYITGFNHGLGFSDSDQRILGGSIERKILEKEKLALRLTYLDGTNKNPDNYNSSTLEGGTEGNIFSIAVASQLMGEKLMAEAEYSSSRFDSDLSDTLGKESDKAWLIKFSGRESRANWDAGYKYLGPDFRSIANPTGSFDREEFHVGGGIRLPSSYMNIRIVHNQDNVEEDPLMPVIRNSTGMLTYNLNISGWPSIFLTETFSIQDSTKEPGSFTPIESNTNTSSIGFAIARQRWNFSPSYTFTRFNDRTGADADSRTHVVTLAGGIRPWDRVSINPSFSYTSFHTKSTGVTTKTYQGTLGSVLGLMDNRMNINSTLSYLDTRAEDGSSHTGTFNGIAQINWHVEEHLFKTGRQTLSIRGQYTRTRDHVLSNSQSDYAVYGVISFVLPLKIL